jgi:hypothetical protein
MSQVAATETAQTAAAGANGSGAGSNGASAYSNGNGVTATAAMGAAAMASATLAASANSNGMKVGRCLRPCPCIPSSGTPMSLRPALPVDRTSWVLGLPARAR